MSASGQPWGDAHNAFPAAVVPEVDKEVKLIPGHHGDSGRPEEIREIEQIRKMRDDEAIEACCTKGFSKLAVTNREGFARGEAHREDFRPTAAGDRNESRRETVRAPESRRLGRVGRRAPRPPVPQVQRPPRHLFGLAAGEAAFDGRFVIQHR